ncbi:hypothetical protein BT96DRAFT_834310, partial [Gymnopus androsaceus JB14]
AMDILPAQGMLVPSEHVLSSAGETNTDNRSHMSLEMMEALQVLKFGIKSKGTLSFSWGFTQEQQLEYLESLTNDIFAVPINTQVYIESLKSYETFVTY